jgi:outer membrane protein TolC
MKIKEMIIALMLVLLSLGMLSAQSLVAPVTPLRIDEPMVESKVFTSFTYRAARIQYNIDQRDNQWWSFLVPQASFQVAQSVGNKVFTDNYNSNSASPNKWSPSLGFSAGVNVALSNVINIPIIAAKYENKELTFDQTRTAIINQAKLTFYLLIAEREKLNVLQSSVTAAQLAYNQTLASFRSGLVDRVTMLTAQYQYQMLQSRLDTARTGFESALLQFKQLLGINLEQPIELVGEIVISRVAFNGDRLAANYLDGATAVKIEENNREQAFMLQFLNAFNIISPFVGLNYNFAHNFERAGRPASNSDAAGLTLGISVNLSYNLLKDVPSIMDGYALQREAVIEKRKSVRIDIINAANQLNDLQSAIAVAIQNVTINQESLRLTQVAHRQGLKTYTELQNAIVNLQDAQVTLLQSKYDYLNTLLNLAAILGVEPNTLLSQVRNQAQR